MTLEYTDNGYRRTITGARSHKVEDNAIVYNLRFRFKEQIAKFSDEQLLNSYDEFAVSEDFGDDMRWFNFWLPEQGDNEKPLILGD